VVTQTAFDKSTLGNGTVLQDLGIDPGSTSPFGRSYFDVFGNQVVQRDANKFENDIIGGGPLNLGTQTLLSWLLRGAIREDDNPIFNTESNTPGDLDSFATPPGNYFRPWSHFYDPARDRALTVTIPPGITIPPGFIGAQKAPDWAIGTSNVFSQPNGANKNRANHFTWFDAREAMYRALTGRRSDGVNIVPGATASGSGGSVTDPEGLRNAYWATTFRALGDIVHLVQDMAQPQHTRNEPHAADRFDGTPGIFGHKSAYERYVDLRATRGSLANPGGTSTPASALNLDGYPIPAFSNYLPYFTTRQTGVDILSRKGLADYSNRGFFSAGKNLGQGEYDNPSNDAGTYTFSDVTAQYFVIDPAGSVSLNNVGVRVLLGSVTDSLNPAQSAQAVPLTAFGLWDQSLQNLGQTLSYTLNKSNYDAMADLLIPRAVSYSAGLINYFFRGKIDIVPDPKNPGSHRIKNLGTEPMAGKFALYYDAADGTRIPVPDANGNPLVWDSRVILADSSGVLVPNSDMPVIGFIPPTTPVPKRVGEYMLVFAGDIGEEKADAASGVVGAVAAKHIEVTAGGLYLAAVDTNNNYVGLRVDKNGTKVLSAADFDPLGSIVIGQTFPQIQFIIRGDAHTHKQVAFTPTVNGWSYQTLAFGRPRNFFLGFQSGYVRNAPTSAFTEVQGRPWTAKSPDPAIGTFQFFFTTNTSGQAFLHFTRRFVDFSGTTRTASGQVSLPSSTDLAFYLSFGGDQLPVSEDGLHVGEFPISTTTITGDSGTQNLQEVTNKQYHELLITLSATPTAQLNPLISFTDTAAITTTYFKGFQISQTATAHTTVRHFIGYFNGDKQVYTDTLDFNSSESAGTSGNGLCHSGLGFGNYQETIVHTYQFPDGSLSGTTTCDESAGRHLVSGKEVSAALTQHASDAIYQSPTFSTNFRDIEIGDITGGLYIADASPLGEVFFATPDLSVVIHEPLPGGMPKVVIPPNIVRLLAALWL
jgi:hypothetical protein